MLVASELATAGSVIANAERNSPFISGSSHSFFCSSVPTRWISSMLPVSGAAQLVASGASSRHQPISSAIGAYSSWVSPDSDGRKRFQRPRSLALALSSSRTGGTSRPSSPGGVRWPSSDASAGRTSSWMNACRASYSSTAFAEGAGKPGYIVEPVTRATLPRPYGGRVTARRVLPTEETAELLRLVRQIAADQLAPRSAAAEEESAFPRDVFLMLGRTGLLGLPYPEEYGGGGLSYEVYLQVLEEIGAVWASVGVGVSVHALSCFGLVTRGTEEQKQRWLPDMLGGELLGAYCLSEPHAGSDPAAMRTTARRDGDEWVLRGTKAWTTHGGHADFYKLMARTGEGRNDISCFLVPADAPGLSSNPPEKKMGLTGSATTTMNLDDVRISSDRLLGAEGDGLRIALAGLDSGRLGIAAVATGLAQGALDAAVAYAQERETFGKRIIDHQGLAFVLADMEACVQSARATTLHAARLKDAGLPFGREASVAKLVATDNAMKVTTDAVQVLGGYGYTRDFPVERYMREAKVMQIFEGTNQIQRMVIGRSLDTDPPGSIGSV